MMRIDILTLFPQMFISPFSQSIVKRAVDRKLVEIQILNIRDYTHDPHRVVDDSPYGGGTGMVLKPETIFEAVEAVATQAQEDSSASVILLTPQGRLLCHQIAQELAKKDHLILICGHYEGVDERVRQHLVDDELSIGDYVLSGGELAAMVVVDVVVRLLPGALGSEMSAEEDSHAAGLLEYPQYTRPAEFRGWSIPQILLSGNHAEIGKWRREQSILRTLKRRPDLLEKATLSPQERGFVERMKQVRDEDTK